MMIKFLFSFCEPDGPAIEDTNGTGTGNADSGFSSAPSSRLGSVLGSLQCEKKQNIPLPTFPNENATTSGDLEQL